MRFGRIENGTKKPPLNQTEVQSPGGYQSFSIRPLRAFSRRSMPLVGHLPSDPYQYPRRCAVRLRVFCPEGSSALVVSWLTEGLRRAAQRRRNYHKSFPGQPGIIILYARGFHRLLTLPQSVWRKRNCKSGGGGGIRTRGRGKPTHAFQACAFVHSATPPGRALWRRRVRSARFSGEFGLASPTRGAFQWPRE